MKKRFRIPLKLISTLIIIILMFLIPTLHPDEYFLGVLIMTLLWIYLASSWNIIGGYGGQLSFGHAAFYGIGAYTSTILFMAFGVTPWVGMFAGGILSALVGMTIGVPSFRLRGPFYALTMLATAEIFKLVFLRFKDVTGGARGLLLPVRPGLIEFQFVGTTYYYYIILSMVIIIIAATYKLENSNFGLYLMSIREDEDAAETLGIDAFKCKLKAAAISSFFTALGGTFYAQYIGYFSPHTIMTLDVSEAMVVMTIVGGAGTIFGPVIGAGLLTPVQYILTAYLGGTYAGANLIVNGAILIVVVLFLPMGLYGSIKGRIVRMSIFRKEIGRGFD